MAVGVGTTFGIVLVETAGRAITGEQLRLIGVDPVGRALSLVVVGALTGLAVGAAQRLALRRYGVVPGSWIVRSVAAFGVGLPGGGLAADLFTGGLKDGSGFAVFPGVAGLLVGVVTVPGAELIALGVRVREVV